LPLSGNTSTAVHELTGTFACELLSKPVDVTVLNQAITRLYDPEWNAYCLATQNRVNRDVYVRSH
jgi:hypothetical protein